MLPTTMWRRRWILALIARPVTKPGRTLNLYPSMVGQDAMFMSYCKSIGLHIYYILENAMLTVIKMNELLPL
jgi:hypothetical protein